MVREVQKKTTGNITLSRMSHYEEKLLRNKLMNYLNYIGFSNLRNVALWKVRYDQNGIPKKYLSSRSCVNYRLLTKIYILVRTNDSFGILKFTFKMVR